MGVIWPTAVSGGFRFRHNWITKIANRWVWAGRPGTESSTPVVSSVTSTMSGSIWLSLVDSTPGWHK